MTPIVHTSQASNEAELKRELITLSLANPDSYFTFSAGFSSVRIHQHAGRVGNNWGEDCYRTFGGFFKAGRVVKPSSAWLRQYNHIPVRD